MTNASLLLLAESSIWQKFVEVLTTPSLQLFLLLGSLILAISLLLLTMTRLGHARPITKCVVLSVIAHVLLLGYAYGTKLIFQAPVVQKEAPIQINLIEYELEEDKEEPVAENELVKEFATETLVPEAEPLQRPEADSPFELERVFDIELPDEPFESHQLDIAALEAQTPQLNIQPPESQYLEQQPSTPITGMEPSEIEFQRRGAGDEDVTYREPEMRTDEIDVSNELDEVEIEPSIIDENAFPSNEERAAQFQSELKTPDGNHMMSDKFAAATSVSEASGSENQQPETVDPPDQVDDFPQRRLGDGLELPYAFRNRSLKKRAAAAKAGGGSDETETAVESSLKWLANTQKPDGRWCPKESAAGREDNVFGHNRGGCGANAENGITALATLAFLGAGHSHLEGDYKDNVQRALEYLVRSQASNGDLSGDAKLFARMYCHSMSLLALSEALAITGDHRLKQPVKQGVAFTVQAQNKTDGGWRYQPGDSGDMSQFGWKVMALHSAKLGGVNIEQATESRMHRFLESCRAGEQGGLASYRPKEGPSTTMTAESLACRYFLEQPLAAGGLQEAHERILGELPNTSKINLYFWYYASLALHQSGGKTWETWNAELQRVLLSQQQKSGELAGSWEPNGLWGGYGGRIYSTSLATLCLEVYYRYQPIGPNGAKAEATANMPGSEVYIPR